MSYREFQSAPPLSKHVEWIWLLESGYQREHATPERILPDGCFELILNVGSPLTWLAQNKVSSFRKDFRRDDYVAIEPRNRHILLSLAIPPLLDLEFDRIACFAVQGQDHVDLAAARE
jgi:uncharacterized protein DUF6597